MPQWSAPSELWMQRMLCALEGDVSAIACISSPQRYWHRQVPVISLQRASLFWRACRRMGITLPDPATRRLEKLVRSTAVTRVLVHFAEFAVRYARVWDAAQKPLFVHCHGYDVTWDLRRHSVGGPRCFDRSYPESVRRLSERAILIANSRCTAAKLEEIGVQRSRIVQRYIGVPVPPSLPVRVDKPRQTTILFLGRLVDFKGPDQVIRAFELACERGLEGRLVIAGDGPLGAMCELMRHHSPVRDRIELVGEVDPETGSRLRREADIFTAHSCVGPLSHQAEQFGVAFAEAIADGLPVVTGRAGAIEEIVEDGKSGILFTPHDIDAHARALLALSRSPERRAQMGREGWERARRLFPLTNETVELRQILGLTSCATS